MGIQNSLLEVSTSELIASLNDVASASTYPNAELSRDVRTIRARVKAEGLSFLTKTIPSLGKAVDTALSTATPLRFRGFKLKHGTHLPQFLGWMLGRVFDDVGNERSDASIEALIWLRQVCALLYKLEVPTTEKQNDKTIIQFCNTDRDLPDPNTPGFYSRVQREGHGLHHGVQGESQGGLGVVHDPPESYRVHSGLDDQQGQHLVDPHVWGDASGVHSVYVQSVLLHARRLVCRVVGGSDPRGAQCAPRHGPGAVADGEENHEKPSFRRIYRGLDRVFPFGEYFCFNSTHICDSYQDWQSFESREAGTAKVVLVPKDSRGPRLISKEPVEYQWMQQGLRRVLEKAINSSPLTRGMVVFDDQTKNRDLALAASAGAPWVTLDMKDASDRVSVLLVRALFPNHWYECLMACRTSSTRLPSGEVFPMRKFAPMGSSLCFPVESLVFWALSVAAILHEHSTIDAFQASRMVHVYGDDLIVRTEDQGAILRTLPLLNLKFNEKKCCTAGSFRESCGCDAYKGVDVTPLRIKCVWDHRSDKSLVQHVALHNAACDKGMFHLADYIYGLVSKVKKFPYSESTKASYVCWVDSRKTADQVKAHNSTFALRCGTPRGVRNLQRREMHTWCVRTRLLKASVPGFAEMLRVASLRSSSFVKNGEEVKGEAPEGPFGPYQKYDSTIRYSPTSMNFDSFIPVEPSVKAYHYTSRREVSLKRRWCEV